MNTRVWNLYLSARGRGLSELDATRFAAEVCGLSVELAAFYIVEINAERVGDDG